MGRVRHKRKSRHVLLVTSDAVDAEVKQYRFHPRIMYTLVLIFCIVIGIASGYYIYERDELAASAASTRGQQDLIAALEQENKELETQIEVLNERIQILSDTVNQKTLAETELTEQLNQQAIPSEFPLTSSASMEEGGEDAAICIFTAAEGAMVVATARGTVMAVNDDAEYGHNVWIDHGNGYVTIYRNQGDAKVKQGESVAQGATLFLIGEENSKLGYQMMKDGEYINPMEILVISG